MTAWLRGAGYPVNRKRVQRLLQLLGLETIYPKPKTSTPAPGHRIYPYLLRGLPITHADQVWSAEIVRSQKTKADRLAVGAGRDHVADLDVAVGDDDSVDQQLDQ